MRLVPAERTALCDLFSETGPTAPTVLPGWRAEELLAHLLVRERMPLAAPGILVSPLARVAEAGMRSYARLPWSRQVELLRSGPPPWSPYWPPPVDERANLAEFFVHFEDLARARANWRPRPADERRDEALWSTLRLVARVLYRRSPVGVRVRHATRQHNGEITARRGADPVIVIGPPGELVLHAFGRDQAQVELYGSPADLAALEATPRGI
jgi:uncharacterized protein (TIGR03085 family)